MKIISDQSEEKLASAKQQRQDIYHPRRWRGRTHGGSYALWGKPFNDIINESGNLAETPARIIREMKDAIIFTNIKNNEYA